MSAAPHPVLGRRGLLARVLAGGIMANGIVASGIAGGSAVAWATIAGITPPASAQTASNEAVQAPIREFYDALQQQMRLGPSVPFRQRFDKLAPVVERVFDLDLILRDSVGLRWPTLNPAAQANAERAFRRFTVASYVANFDKHDGERFEILPDVRTMGANEVVATHIVAVNGNTTRLDYVMHKEGAEWRAIDVLIQGTISRVAVQRSDFRKLVSPGDASALVASLQQKTAALSGGTLSS